MSQWSDSVTEVLGLGTVKRPGLVPYVLQEGKLRLSVGRPVQGYITGQSKTPGPCVCIWKPSQAFVVFNMLCSGPSPLPALF